MKCSQTFSQQDYVNWNWHQKSKTVDRMSKNWTKNGPNGSDFPRQKKSLIFHKTADLSALGNYEGLGEIVVKLLRNWVSWAVLSKFFHLSTKVYQKLTGLCFYPATKTMIFKCRFFWAPVSTSTLAGRCKPRKMKSIPSNLWISTKSI